MNLFETLIISDECDRYDDRFDKLGIKVIDNTEKEILNATVEMNEKINNTWVRSEDEKKCMEKYWKIINLWKQSHKISLSRRRTGEEGYTMPPMPICYTFLKENRYFLEVDFL